MEHVISYAINHMVAPRRSFAELLELATSLGLDQVEIRNDLDGVAMCDGTPPDRVIRLLSDQAPFDAVAARRRIADSVIRAGRYYL